MTNLNFQVKALVFDAYGTLFDMHSVIAECNRVFPGQGDALSELWSSKPLEYRRLRSLHKKYRLAILSNGTPPTLEAVARNAGIREHFDALLSVDAVRVYKPDPRAYEIAPRELRLARAEIGFVSSNPFDVAGGKNFGFNTIWLHRHPAPFDVLGVKPDLEINALSELVR